ncbi:hypothetical protein SLEP1_g42345 [Rubroshorea leprosula]|uniref:Uncharacterized protein n=1 Tax=Rubroshorea leprosula TaxID=152421 RepID=A0AAV5L9H9_9ROSI|nr:hypothetical protein SLEP1_g42345 [Rubroshorea leprosula]
MRSSAMSFERGKGEANWRTQELGFARNPARGVPEEPSSPGSRGTQLARFAPSVKSPGLS